MRDKRKDYLTNYYRKLRRIYCEYLDLLDQKRNLGWIILDKPIRKGYVKTYRIKSDYLYRMDSEFFKRALGLFQNSIYSKDKKFILKKFIKGRGYVKQDMVLNPVCVDFKMYDSLPGDIKKLFHYTEKYFDSYANNYRGERGWVTGYYPKALYFVEEVIKPNYVTKVRIIDPKLESKISKAGDFVDKYFKTYMRKIWHQKYNSRYDWGELTKEAKKGLLLDEEIKDEDNR